MPEMDLVHGCVMRELQHAIDTGTAQAFGEAIARGIKEYTPNRKKASPQNISGMMLEAEYDHLPSVLGTILHLPPDQPGLLVTAVRKLWDEYEDSAKRYVLYEELLQRARGTKRCQICGASYRKNQPHDDDCPVGKMDKENGHG